MQPDNALVLAVQFDDLHEVVERDEVVRALEDHELAVLQWRLELV